jgi:putative ABC transport system permease protein
MFDSLLQDVRFGARVLRKNPGFSAIIIICLALGIGPSTTAFSLINASLLRPVDVARPEELVSIAAHRDGDEQIGRSLSYPNYLDVRDRCESFAGLVACGGATVSIRSGKTSEMAFANLVSSNYFDVLGRNAMIGEVFHAAGDEEPGPHAVVVLGYGFWQDRLAANQEVVGSTMRINGHDFKVLGVMSPTFTGHAAVVQPALWAPMSMAAQIRPRDDSLPQQREHAWMRVIGRLRQGISLARVNTELAGASRQLAAEYPATNQLLSFDALPFSGIDPEAEVAIPQIMLLAGVVVGVLLLLSCSSTAALYLARATARRREISIRMAIGASRLRIVQQLLVEGILMALIAGGAALLLTLWAFDLYRFFLPERTAEYIALGSCLDYKLLTFTLFVSVLTGILFGLAPALQISRPDLIAALKNQDGSGDHRGTRLRNVFVVAQFSMAILLSICAGLFVKGLRHASTLDPGFESQRMVIFETDLSLYGYSTEAAAAFTRQLIERLTKVEGVTAVSVSRFPPLSDQRSMTRAVPIAEDMTSQDGVLVGVNDVGTSYFKALGIGLVGGREFMPADDRGAKQVVVVNETLARRLWPGEDAVGKTLMLGFGEAHEVIGIARDSKYWTLGEQDVAFVYFPIAQVPSREIALCLRTDGDPDPIVAKIGQQIAALNSDLALSNLRTIQQQTYRALWPARVATILFTFLGGLAILLSVIGVYGVVSYSVTRRRLEIGIRLALGGQPRDLVLLLVRQGLKLVAVGTVLGMVLASGTTHFLAPLLNGVSPTDLQVFCVVPLLLLGVAWLANYFPARRATQVDPMVVLRYE